MATKTEIINKALTKVGAQPITNLDDDTEQARTVNRVWETALKEVLSECKWNFAVKRKNLTRLDVTLDWYYTSESYVYQKPNDIVRIFGFSDRNITCREEGEYIISDTIDIGILYVYYLEDPTKYSPSFIGALSDKLCSEIAYKIVNSATLGQEYLVAYETLSLPKAMTANSQIGTQIVPEDDAWVDAKFADGQPNA